MPRSKKHKLSSRQQHPVMPRLVKPEPTFEEQLTQMMGAFEQRIRADERAKVAAEIADLHMAIKDLSLKVDGLRIKWFGLKRK